MQDLISTKRYCYNCGRLLHSIRGADHTAKFFCTCGVIMYSKIKSRRREDDIVTLPVDSYIGDSGTLESCG